MVRNVTEDCTKVQARYKHLWKLDDDRRRQRLLGNAIAEERGPPVFRGYVTVVNKADLDSSALMLK